MSQCVAHLRRTLDVGSYCAVSSVYIFGFVHHDCGEIFTQYEPVIGSTSCTLNIMSIAECMLTLACMSRNSGY